MAQQEEHNRERGLPPIDESLVINTRLREIEREQAEEKKRDYEYRERQLRFNKLTVIFTAGLLAANVIYDGLTTYLARTARISAEAAQSAAETASKSLEQGRAESSAQDKRARDGIDASAKQAADSIKQARGALSVSIAASRNDQRAWVGTTTISSPLFTDSQGKRVYLRDGINDRVVSTVVVNSGKTPALNYYSTTAMSGQPKGTFKPLYNGTEPDSIQSLSVLQPGKAVILRSGRQVVPMPKSALDRVIEGVVTVYFYGEIRYADVFGVAHLTHFCMQLLPDLSDFEDCSTYNDAN